MSRATAASYEDVKDVDWWSEKDDHELAQKLATVFNVVQRENAWRTDKDEYHWGLYEGTGLGGVTLRSRRNMTYANATLPDNVCKMATDTLTAKVATIRPIPQVFPNRANWKDVRRARKMRQLIEGEFYRQGIHEKLAPRIIKDALIARGGVVQVFVPEDGKAPKVERCHVWTLFVDDWDAEEGEPLSMFRLKTKNRRAVMAKYGKTPELKDRIRNAGRLSSDRTVNRDEERSSTVDRIELLEAWHRCPDHPENANDNSEGEGDKKHKCIGRHVIICEGATIFEEEWPHPYFPFAILTYDTPNTGLWGTGLVQSIEGYQVSANEANEKLDEMLANSAVHVVLRDGGGVFETDVVDGVRVLKCRSGYEPQIFNADLVNEHVRARPRECVQNALQSSGISQMAAQSVKAPGIESGIAIQTIDDIESQRHIVFGRRFESWCLDVARLLIECVKKIATEHGEYSVDVPMQGAYLPLKWSDAKIDGFQLQMQSVGQLYMSFAGRLDKLKTLFEMGAIDRGTFMRQLDAGDLQAELDLETVDRLIVDEMIEAMLDTDPDFDGAANDNGDYIAPNGYLPLQWAHRRAHQKRLKAQMDGASVAVLELLGRFIDDLAYLMDKAEADAKAKALQAQTPLAGTAMTTNLAAQPTPDVTAGVPSPAPEMGTPVAA